MFYFFSFVHKKRHNSRTFPSCFEDYDLSCLQHIYTEFNTHLPVSCLDSHFPLTHLKDKVKTALDRDSPDKGFKEHYRGMSETCIPLTQGVDNNFEPSRSRPFSNSKPTTMATENKRNLSSAKNECVFLHLLRKPGLRREVRVGHKLLLVLMMIISWLEPCVSGALSGEFSPEITFKWTSLCLLLLLVAFNSSLFIGLLQN